MSTFSNSNQLAASSGPTDFLNRYQKKPITLEDVLSRRLIDLTKVVKSEPVVTIYDSVFARQGDFSLIMGQRKAGKTTVSQFIVATALMQRIPSDLDTLGIHTRFCEGNDVIYVDTEGSEEDTADFLKGVLGILDKAHKPENLHIYRLREYTQDECKEAVELLFRHHANSHLWLIDGIADLVKSPNQETESNEAVRWVMKNAGELKTCMILIIHENPGDSKKARGHLGSELERKAGGAIAVVKDKTKKPPLHLIQARFLRKSADFEDIAFQFDPDTRRPFTTALSVEERAAYKSKGYEKTQELILLRDKCFVGIDSKTEKELKNSIRFVFGPLQISKDSARMKASRSFESMLEKGLIKAEKRDEGIVYLPIDEKGNLIQL